MEDDDIPPLVGVLPIPKPDPPAKKQAPLANFFGLPRPIAFSRMPGSSTKIIAPTDGLAFDPGAGERSRAEAVARSCLDAVIAGEIGVRPVVVVRRGARRRAVDRRRRRVCGRCSGWRAQRWRRVGFVVSWRRRRRRRGARRRSGRKVRAAAADEPSAPRMIGDEIDDQDELCFPTSAAFHGRGWPTQKRSARRRRPSSSRRP